MKDKKLKLVKLGIVYIKLFNELKNLNTPFCVFRVPKNLNQFSWTNQNRKYVVFY